MLSGALLAFAFAPFNTWSSLFSYLVVLPLSLFFYQLTRVTTARLALLLGWLFGVSLFTTGVSWIYVAIHDFGAAHWSLAAALTALFIGFIAGFYALLGWSAFTLLQRFNHSGRGFRLFMLALLWVFFEWLRSWVLTGFPWLIAGYPLIQTPLSGYAPVFGIFGLSLLVALMAILLISHWQKKLILACLAGLFLSGWGLGKIPWTEVDGKALQVAIIQGNVPQKVKWNRDQLAKTMRLYQTLSADYWQQSDLIIWPENAIPVFYHVIEKQFYEPLKDIALGTNTELITGLPVFDDDSGRYYNSMTNLGEKQGFYFKTHLVPFGEYVPLEGLIRGLIQFFNLPMSGFAEGNREQPLLNIKGHHVTTTLCYEDVYATAVTRAIPQSRFMVNLSNNGWYGNSLAPHQHLEMARMRALETGREIIRSTTSGISAIIDSHGELRVQGPQFEQAVIQGVVYPRAGITPFVRWGNYPLLILFALMAVYLFLAGRKPVNK